MLFAGIGLPLGLLVFLCRKWLGIEEAEGFTGVAEGFGIFFVCGIVTTVLTTAGVAYLCL